MHPGVTWLPRWAVLTSKVGRIMHHLEVVELILHFGAETDLLNLQCIIQYSIPSENPLLYSQRTARHELLK